MTPTSRFGEALAYANRIHATQVRKGADIPYVSHLLGVASLAIEMGADEDQAIAALLHDAVEDQGGLERLEDIRKTFGDRVAGMVADCTDSHEETKPDWRPRKEAYLVSLANKPADSLLVSLADKTHNARAIVDDLIEHGDVVWDRFRGGKDGSLWYYRTLAAAFEALLPGAGARRLLATVAMMEALASASLIKSETKAIRPA